MEYNGMEYDIIFSIGLDVRHSFQSFLRASDIAKEAGFLKDWDTFKPNPWLPIIDAKYVKKDPFIPESPIQIIKQGKFNKTPIMTGHTKNEGTMFLCIMNEVITW